MDQAAQLKKHVDEERIESDLDPHVGPGTAPDVWAGTCGGVVQNSNLDSSNR